MLPAGAVILHLQTTTLGICLFNRLTSIAWDLWLLLKRCFSYLVGLPGRPVDVVIRPDFFTVHTLLTVNKPSCLPVIYVFVSFFTYHGS